MNQDMKLTLLSEEEIWGVNGDRQLGVLEKYGTIAAITDLVILTGGHCEYTQTYTSPDDKSLKGRTGWFYTRSSDSDGDVRGVNPDGSRYWGSRYKRNGAVRPALLSSSVFSQIYPNRVRGYNGTEEVMYGEYPQYAPCDDMQKRLESKYQRGNLQTTGRDYTFDRTRYDDCSQGFQPIKYEEYEYQGKRYIRVQARSDNYVSKFKLSNGEKYKDGDNVWVEISPVVWLIDDRTKTLVSKRGLLAGIRFYIYEKRYHGDFSKTDMKEYLDKYMVHDLFQNILCKKSEESNNNFEIMNLLKEIKKYKKYYHGDINIDDKVKELVDGYNRDLDNLKEKSNQGILSLNSKSVESVYKELISNLEDILLELKKTSLNVKCYYDMLDILSECKKTRININKDELCDFIASIKHTIYICSTNYDWPNSFDNEINIIIEKHINKNKQYIKEAGCNINNKNDMNTLDLLKTDFRRDIQLFLINLKKEVVKIDIVSEIMSNIRQIVNNLYKDSKNERVGYLLNIIQDIAGEIKSIVNEEDIKELDNILRFDVDYTLDLESIFKELNLIVVRLYKLQLEIIEREKIISEINSLKIDDGILSVLNDESIINECDNHMIIK